MKKWLLKGTKLDCKEIATKLNIDAILVRLMINRGIAKEEMKSFIHKSREGLHSPHLLTDIQKASSIILEHISKRKKIRIVGDYDVDGVCATTILYKGLMELGAIVDYAIPNRMVDGYGINEQIVHRAFEEGVGLIITCDNGIAANEACDYAAKIGLDIVITDHHAVPIEIEDEKEVQVLPKALAVVDPSRKDDTYPFKKICGALVAYKLINHLFNIVEKDNDLDDELLIFAGIATVCDVMPLIDENRVVVDHALKEIGSSNNPGINAILEVFEVDKSKVSVSTFGFVIGPAINSSGRLSVALKSVNLFCLDDEVQAKKTATHLRELNVKRQALTEEGLVQAINYIESNNLEGSKVIVVHLKDVNESVAGIIAGRLKERYYRPILVFVDVEDGIKGSGRSIEAYDMFMELSRIKKYFTKFGGHKMAAGFSTTSDNLNIISRLLNEGCTLKEEELIEQLEIDLALPFKYLSLDFMDTLELLEPYGLGNLKPRFAQKFVKVISYALIGKNKNFLRLELDDGVLMKAVIFNRALELYEVLQDTKVIDVVYIPQINVWNKNRNVQILIEDFRKSE